MNANITIEGLDQLQKRFGQHQSIITAELKPAIREGAELLKDDAKKRAPGHKLLNSIRVSVESGGLEATIDSSAKTAYSIEVGRPANGPMPPVELIDRWIAQHGEFGETVSVKTHRVVRSSLKSGARARHDAAWELAKEIQKRGTKPLAFLMPAVPAQKEAVAKNFNRHIGLALRKLAGK